MNLIVWMLVTYGITLIVTQSKIARPLRGLIGGKKGWLCAFIHCPMCVGFWIGGFLSLLSLSPSFWAWGHRYFILDGFASSAVCWIVHVIISPFVPFADEVEPKHD